MIKGSPSLVPQMLNPSLSMIKSKMNLNVWYKGKMMGGAGSTMNMMYYMI